LWLRISERHPIAALPDLLYTWRDHGGSVSRRHLEEQTGFAARARLAARRRWCSALVGELRAGEVSVGRAARRALTLRCEEETALPAMNRRAALRAACARRLPCFYACCYSLRHLRALVRLRRILASYTAGRRDPCETCAALIGELDPALYIGTREL
jgi:hypothetical protein